MVIEDIYAGLHSKRENYVVLYVHGSVLPVYTDVRGRKKLEVTSPCFSSSV